MKLSQQQLRGIVKQAINEAPVPTISVYLRVDIDADDLIDEVGLNAATEALKKAVNDACGDVNDVLSDNILEHDGIPVAVRDVRVVSRS